MALTPRQEKFAQEYVLTGNAAEAYRTAYPKSLKWKDNSVYTQSSLLLGNIDVSQRVKELQAEVKEKFDISAERLLLEQSRLALFDQRRLFDENGRLLHPKDFPDDAAAAVSSIKVTRRMVAGSEDAISEDVIEVKLWSKNAALDSLFKNKGLYERDNKQAQPAITITISPEDAKL